MLTPETIESISDDSASRRRRPRAAATGPAAALACVLLALNACSYSFTRVEGDKISYASPTVILASAEDAYRAGEFSRAAHLGAYIADEYPDAPEAEDAFFFTAESYYQMGDLKDSFELFKNMIQRFPATRYSRIVVERDFAIGQAYFEPGTGLFGVFKNRGFGVKVMNHLLTYFPTSDLADDAQLAIGEYYFSKDDFIPAAEALERLVNEYPMSEWVEKSTFMAGSSYFLLNRGPAYDRDSLLRAIEIFQLYLQRYPRGFFAEQAETRLIEAVDRMAEKEMQIAHFYLNQDQDFGARVHLANVVLLFPDTDPGREAKQILDARGWDTSLNSKDTIKPRRRFGRNR